MEEIKVKGTIHDWALGIQAQLLVALWSNSTEDEREALRPKMDEMQKKMKNRITFLVEFNQGVEEIGSLARDFRARD